MKLIEYIKELLLQKGKASIEGLGTFTAEAKGASMKDDEGIMLPPSLQVSFSNEASAYEDHSLKRYALEKGEIDPDDINSELEAFVEGIQNTLSQDGKCVLEGLGMLKKPMDGGGPVFEQDKDLILGGDSFGLPKIEPRLLTPATSAAPPAPIAKESNRLLVAAIAIPLAVLFCVFLYFLYNKPAYDSVVAYFTNTPATAVTDSTPASGGQSGSAAAENNKPEEGNEGDKGGKAEASPSSTEPEPSKSGSTAQPAEKEPAKAEPSTPSNSEMLVTSSDGRFYVIIGSYTDVASAEKRARKCRKIGYGTAKVVQRNSRIRVSLEDFSRKADASAFAAKVGKDYNGAWVFAN